MAIVSDILSVQFCGLEDLSFDLYPYSQAFRVLKPLRLIKLFRLLRVSSIYRCCIVYLWEYSL
jgi:hypothetical protein